MNWDIIKQVAIVARKIVIRGEEVLVHIRELTVEEAEKIFAIAKDAKEGSMATRQALLASAVVNEDGTPALAEDEVKTLPVSVANALEKEALAVNGFTKESATALGNAQGSTAPIASASDSPAT